MKNNVWTNQALANESIEDYGAKIPGGRFGGNFDRMINDMIVDHSFGVQKHQKFDPKKPESDFLRQTDKFWTPADLPI